MTSSSPDSQAPITAALPTAAQRLPWLERLSKYRQPIGLAITLLLFAMALIACRHLLSELDIYALHDAMLSVPRQALLVILLGYEWSAARYAGVKLPPRIMVLGGFSAFAIGNAIGLSMLSGGSVRYRLYARQGIGAAEVAHHRDLHSFPTRRSSDLQSASTALRLSPLLLGSIATAVLLASVVLAIGLYRRRAEEQPLADNLLVKLGRRTLRLPSARLTGLQLLITALDVATTEIYTLSLHDALPISICCCPRRPPSARSSWCTCWPWRPGYSVTFLAVSACSKPSCWQPSPISWVLRPWLPRCCCIG